ncbi:MAG: hypothetical protein ACLQU2_16830 [Candidatus Binataceae bacterium]
MARFTSKMPEELLYRAKLEALNRRVSLHVILAEAVAAYLKQSKQGETTRG